MFQEYIQREINYNVLQRKASMLSCYKSSKNINENNRSENKSSKNNNSKINKIAKLFGF
jgi:hypothetical protein